MDLELKDKVAIVGGASKGLGQACAQALAHEGVKVALCSRAHADLERAAQEIRDTAGTDVLVFAGDLDRHDTIRDLIAATVGRFGRLDIMVNNSGGPPLARAHDATEEQWADLIRQPVGVDRPGADRPVGSATRARTRARRAARLPPSS